MKKILTTLFLICTTAFVIAQNTISADALLQTAYKKAAVENKKVFIIFHASWCGWCKKLDASLNDESVKQYFDNNFVIVHLTVQETAAKKLLENPGAAELLKKYNGEKAGLPFFVINDKKKKVIGNSIIDGEGIGCPANEKEVNGFVTLLKKATKINLEMEQAIISRFRKNE